MSDGRLPSSFRDPSGFLFFQDGIIHRQINKRYQGDYDRLMESGLYEELCGEGLLIPHEDAGLELARTDEAYKVIRPEPLQFISHPYEWCFSQLKDAALATLEIQKRAFQRGMTLKDASAYNIQFHHGRALLIDTLSFETYREGEPWIAYRQFCQHFLAPLALMSYTDVRLSQLLRIYIDGIPLDLCSALLPFRTRLSFSLLTHLHIHAYSQKRFAGRTEKPKARKIGKMSFQGFVASLENSVRRMRWRQSKSVWGDYYDETNYSSRAMAHKVRLVEEFIEEIRPAQVWDFGANTGTFSRLASEKGIPTLSFDMDALAVEYNYQESRSHGEKNILPLVIDLTNPSPDIGWANEERASLLKRGPTDAALALALVHHLAIANNLPLAKIAAFFGGVTKWLIIEFVPKADSQVQRMLSTREDIFTDYTREAFETEFGRHFKIVHSRPIEETERTLYLMENMNAP